MLLKAEENFLNNKKTPFIYTSSTPQDTFSRKLCAEKLAYTVGPLLCRKIGIHSGTSLALISFLLSKSTCILMTPKKFASKSTAARDAYMKHVTENCSKEIIKERGQGSVITHNILKQLMDSSKVRVVIKENSLYDNFKFPSC